MDDGFECAHSADDVLEAQTLRPMTAAASAGGDGVGYQLQRFPRVSPPWGRRPQLTGGGNCRRVVSRLRDRRNRVSSPHPRPAQLHNAPPRRRPRGVTISTLPFAVKLARVNVQDDVAWAVRCAIELAWMW